MPTSEWTGGEGGCRCGRVRLRVEAPPLITMACHCTGCQRMSASAFSLTVQYVLRGSTGRTLELEDLAAGPCSGPVTVRVGERIAIAFGLSDRLLFGDATWAAVAWIRGTPPRLPDIEQLTVSEVFRTLGVEPPETSTVTPARQTVPIGLLLVVGLGVLAIVVTRPFPQGGSR